VPGGLWTAGRHSLGGSASRPNRGAPASEANHGMGIHEIAQIIGGGFWGIGRR